MDGETQQDYTWALQQFRDLSNIVPGVFVTDRELALMNALNEVYPETKHLLCLWHIKKNIEAKGMKYIKDPQELEAFNELISALVDARTGTHFEAIWAILEHQAPNVVVNYIRDN
ncbi:hypothetical protein GEMRC1_009627 [Eukaryota sp. GEM-RC1]